LVIRELAYLRVVRVGVSASCPVTGEINTPKFQ